MTWVHYMVYDIVHCMVHHMVHCMVHHMVHHIVHCIVRYMLGQPHKMVIMNPKAITSPQMFGCLDVIANEWSEGIFAQLWRRANRSGERGSGRGASSLACGL